MSIPKKYNTKKVEVLKETLKNVQKEKAMFKNRDEFDLWIKLVFENGAKRKDIEDVLNKFYSNIEMPTYVDEFVNYPHKTEVNKRKLNKHTLGAIEAFLHDVWEGESQFEEILNIIGYNELNFLVDEINRLKTENNWIYGSLNQIENILKKCREKEF
jgi:hypothetical protein